MNVLFTFFYYLKKLYEVQEHLKNNLSNYTEAYSETTQTSKMECFEKTVNGKQLLISKTLHFRHLTGFWTRPWQHHVKLNCQAFSFNTIIGDNEESKSKLLGKTLNIWTTNVQRLK